MKKNVIYRYDITFNDGKTLSCWSQKEVGRALGRSHNYVFRLFQYYGERKCYFVTSLIRGIKTKATLRIVRIENADSATRTVANLNAKYCDIIIHHDGKVTIARDTVEAADIACVSKHNILKIIKQKQLPYKMRNGFEIVGFAIRKKNYSTKAATLARMKVPNTKPIVTTYDCEMNVMKDDADIIISLDARLEALEQRRDEMDFVAYVRQRNELTIKRRAAESRLANSKHKNRENFRHGL